MEIKVGQRVRYIYWIRGSDMGHETEWQMEAVGKVIRVKKDTALLESRNGSRTWVARIDIKEVMHGRSA